MKNDEDTTSDMSLQQFYYRHLGIRGAGVCNHHDVPIYTILALKFFFFIKNINFYFRFLLLISFREKT